MTKGRRNSGVILTNMINTRLKQTLYQLIKGGSCDL